MFSYSGPARLVYADGTAADLDRVDLIETETNGLWQLSGAGTAAEVLAAGEARIKLPTGGEADVVVSNVRVSEGARGVSCSVTLISADTRSY
ncbi:hypothetical protein SAMN05216553_106504 [Lentzea fradiae]|uniref:Uncharacterized protein n=1 Tax=Lentzea fradiae TaxID=200378 RepID=A0A1G7SVM8_9PSEU|nr:hypothetical protein [Lentzea fradiae]SDG27103.1 hypothetical protein SAMN05216553_106504 [Lentzea fradiae]